MFIAAVDQTTSNNTKQIVNVEKKNQEKINNANNSKIRTNDQIELKIDSITKSCKLFIKNLLNDLLNKNPQNANIICDYIIAEQVEFNIIDSVYLS